MNESESWNREKHLWQSKCIKAEVTRNRKSLKIPGVPGNERQKLACGVFRKLQLAIVEPSHFSWTPDMMALHWRLLVLASTLTTEVCG